MSWLMGEMFCHSSVLHCNNLQVSPNPIPDREKHLQQTEICMDMNGCVVFPTYIVLDAQRSSFSTAVGLSWHGTVEYLHVMAEERFIQSHCIFTKLCTTCMSKRTFSASFFYHFLRSWLLARHTAYGSPEVHLSFDTNGLLTAMKREFVMILMI